MILILLALALAVVGCAQVGESFAELNVDHPEIQYTTRPVNDPVAELSRKVLSGQLALRFDEQRGYLPAILEALQIPVESQMAVFSKTSVQSMRIDPSHPRALYFNDSVAVGWVPRGTIELASLDPRQGVVFYSVDQRKWTTEGGRSRSSSAGPTACIATSARRPVASPAGSPAAYPPLPTARPVVCPAASIPISELPSINSGEAGM